MEDLNGTVEQMEFKSMQWFGATVRSHRTSILVRIRLCMAIEPSQLEVARARTQQIIDLRYMNSITGLGQTAFSCFFHSQGSFVGQYAVGARSGTYEANLY